MLGLSLKITRASPWRTAGAGSAYDAATEAIAAAFTTPPTTARKNLIDAAVVALKSAGVWAKLDALYAFAAADSQAAKINWKQPGTYNCTEVNSPTFTADQGFTGASTKWLSSSYNPTTAPGAKFTLNNASLFAWSLTAAVIDAEMGGAEITTTTSLRPRHSSNQYFLRLNQGSSNVTGASTDSTGFWAVDRASASLTTGYKNGASLGTDGTVATTLGNNDTTFLKGGNTYWTGLIAAGGFGSSMTGADHTALYNALRTYMDGLYTAANTETNTIVAAFTNPATPVRKALIDTCVGALKAAGVWAKLDALYAFAAADSQAALINWVNPGTYNGTLVNAPAFLADSGFTGASTKYIDTNFNQTTAPSPKFTQNNGVAFVRGTQTTPGNGGLFGNTATSQDVFIYPRYSGTTFMASINANVAGSIANSDGNAFFTVSRTGANILNLYKNGVHQVLDGNGTVAPLNLTFQILRRATDYYLYSVPCAGFGQGLSQAEVTALYNALTTYTTGVGVP